MNDEQRITFHQRAQQGMRRKLDKTYPELKDRLATPPEKFASGFESKFNDRLSGYEKLFGVELPNRHQWENVKRTAAKFSGLEYTDTFSDTLDSIAREAGQRYADAAYLHQQLKKHRNGASEKFYCRNDVKESLAFIYKNHVTNEFDARLRALGLTEESAFRLQGHIIFNSMAACSGMRPPTEYEVRPQRLGGSGHIDLEMQRTHHYWQDEGASLIAAFHAIPKADRHAPDRWAELMMKLESLIDRPSKPTNHVERLNGASADPEISR